MKSLIQYITERVKNLPKSITGLIVFDIDDTLLKSNPDIIGVYKHEPGKPEKRLCNPDIIGVYKHEPGKPEKRLTTEEFAKDPDAADPNKKDWWDYREFRDPVKVYNSIISGTPLIRNLRIMDDYIEAGYEFCFLTARACEETIKKALDDFLKVKKSDGALHELGDIFKKTMSHAINDESKTYEGANDAEKKANILKKLCKEYDRVVFVDDDHKNVSAARGLKMDNLKVIKAWDN